VSHRSFRVRVAVLVLAGALGTALFARIAEAAKKEATQTADEAPTKYYFLMGPFRFTPTDLGATPQVESYGGGPWWLPLEQCEIKAEGLKRWTEGYVTLRYAEGRLQEVGLWYGGVVCRGFAFRYDDAGRLAARVDTEYEPRRQGEDVRDWVERMRGKKPEATCVREIAYVWSADALTVQVKMVSRSEKPTWAGLPEWPTIFYGEPGMVLERWRLDKDGRLLRVLRDDVAIYSATYGGAGRLIAEEREDDRLEHVYDRQGRVVKTTVKRGIGDTMVFVHAYPDAPAPDLPKVDPEDDETFMVYHDQSGNITKVEVAGEVSPIGDFTVQLQRDDQGRVKLIEMVPKDKRFSHHVRPMVFEE